MPPSSTEFRSTIWRQHRDACWTALVFGYFPPVKRHVFALLIAATAFLAGLAIGRYTLPTTQATAGASFAFCGVVRQNAAGPPLRRLGPGHSFGARPRQSGSCLHRDDHRGVAKCDGASFRSAQLHRTEQTDRRDRSEKCAARDRSSCKHCQISAKNPSYLSMLIARWAEGDPQAALVYAQTTGTASDRKLDGVRRGPGLGRERSQPRPRPGCCKCRPARSASAPCNRSSPR